MPQYLPTIYFPTQLPNNVFLKPLQVNYRPIQPKPNTVSGNKDTFYSTTNKFQTLISNPHPKATHSNNDKTNYLSKYRLIERTLCSTALANSTFASTILKLNQLQLADHYSSDHVPIYNTLQESLSAAIKSLMQIQKQLNGWSDESELKQFNRKS